MPREPPPPRLLDAAVPAHASAPLLTQTQTSSRPLTKKNEQSELLTTFRKPDLLMPNVTVDQTSGPASTAPPRSQAPSKTLERPFSQINRIGTPSSSTPRSSNFSKTPSVPFPVSHPIAPQVSAAMNSPDTTSKTPASGAVQIPNLFKAPTGKRFKPLFVKKSTPLAHAVPNVATMPIPVQIAPAQAPPSYSLDLPASPPPTPQPITLPPKMSQRKRVQRWAILLGGLSDEERKQCALVSRMFRYAVYLSAIPLLTRLYAGSRLTQIAAQHPQNMTNMWPYLRYRERQSSLGGKAYAESFLVNFFQGYNPISAHLQTSPDHERQFVIALRQVLYSYLLIDFPFMPDHHRQQVRCLAHVVHAVCRRRRFRLDARARHSRGTDRERRDMAYHCPAPQLPGVLLRPRVYMRSYRTAHRLVRFGIGYCGDRAPAGRLVGIHRPAARYTAHGLLEVDEPRGIRQGHQQGLVAADIARERRWCC
ncbi:hypothetical protein PLICRDRAFT_55783 [Plicaturopsis crispa FD-325 SS-3]|nr:hypothetical protein PLICRDRAFT_55783 [Plicaturopsis crispa FD-325 SS-3]